MYLKTHWIKRKGHEQPELLFAVSEDLDKEVPNYFSENVEKEINQIDNEDLVGNRTILIQISEDDIKKCFEIPAIEGEVENV